MHAISNHPHLDVVARCALNAAIRVGHIGNGLDKIDVVDRLGHLCGQTLVKHETPSHNATLYVPLLAYPRSKNHQP